MKSIIQKSQSNKYQHLQKFAVRMYSIFPVIRLCRIMCTSAIKSKKV